MSSRTGGYRRAVPAPFRLKPQGELFRSRRYPDTKDPCVVHDGARWHVFGTGCGLATGLEVLHWTAPALAGPWREQPPARIIGAGAVRTTAAPGVIAEGRRLHMYLHHDFDILGGSIEHLASDDGGRTFVHTATVLESAEGTVEAGLYDPDAAEVDGSRYLTYAAMSTVGQPDLFLARSTTGSWDGPFERCGRILGHAEVADHNQIDDDDYEWGLEGPQLTQLPDGRVLLTAVCFLAGRPRGTRQRLFLAVSDGPLGPYEVLGPGIPTRGENGHGTSVVAGESLHIVYQERAGEGRRWHIRWATGRLAVPSSLRQAG